jgi:catechol 2,3-dioxygenase-like lactoylglutathione lyase family enzyme
VDGLPIVGLDHVVLRVRDLERALGFYTGVLGLEVERELPPEIGLVQLRAGSALIDLVPLDGAIGRQGGAAPGEGGRNMDHFCLQLEPFDESAVRALLERHGIEAGPTAERYGAKGNGPSIYIRDPDGNTVELKGPGEGAKG